MSSYRLASYYWNDEYKYWCGTCWRQVRMMGKYYDGPESTMYMCMDCENKSAIIDDSPIILIYDWGIIYMNDDLYRYYTPIISLKKL